MKQTKIQVQTKLNTTNSNTFNTINPVIIPRTNKPFLYKIQFSNLIVQTSHNYSTHSPSCSNHHIHIINYQLNSLNSPKS